MLKISLVDGHARRRLIVEGKLIAPWAAVLRIACKNARADLRGRELIVEMQHVTAISQEGENLLLELMNEGVKFHCRGIFTKQVLKQVARRAKTIGQDASSPRPSSQTGDQVR
jgi:hypothetical protein